MSRGKKIAIGVGLTITAAALGYWIYRRQTGARTAIAQNTVNPATGLTPLQEQAIKSAAGALADLEGKFIKLKDTPVNQMSINITYGNTQPTFYIKNGGFQMIAPGKASLVFQRVLGRNDIKDSDDGVKKGIVTVVNKKQLDELMKLAIVPLSTITG